MFCEKKVIILIFVYSDIVYRILFILIQPHSFNSIRIDRQTDIFYNWFMIQESQTLNSNPLQICKDNPNNITYFESFKLIARITGRTSTAYNTNDVEIVAPSKYLNNFWRTLKMLWLIVRFILSMNCVITNSTGAGTFAITDTKLFLSVVTKFTQDNTKQLQQLKSGFKRTINWNKYQLKVLVQAQNHYSYYCLIWDFKELMVLLINDNEIRAEHTGYLRDCNLMIDVQHFFDQPVVKEMTLQLVCFLHYPLLIAIHWRKEQVPDLDPKVIQQINFTKEKVKLLQTFLQVYEVLM